MCSARSSSDRQHQQRQRGGGGELRLRRILEQAPDLGGHGVEAGRQRQDRRRAEQRHRLQEGDQRAGEQRRQHQRNGDAARRVPAAAAEDRRGVLQFAGHAVERIGDQHEDVRESVAGDDEDDAGQRVDVEQMLVLLGAGDGAEDLVEQAAVRAPPAAPRRWRRGTAASRMTPSPARGSRRRTADRCAPPKLTDRYRGTVSVFVNSLGRLTVVNNLNFEDYLKGVVPNEIGGGSIATHEAIKAQAVAARTYAYKNLHQFETDGYDLLQLRDARSIPELALKVQNRLAPLKKLPEKF